MMNLAEDDFSTGDGYALVIIGFDIELESSALKKWVDKDGAFPYNANATRDDDLRNIPRDNNGICGVAGADVFDLWDEFDHWRAFRTTNEVDITSGQDVDDRLLFKHFIETTANADAGDRADIVIFTGFWNDDGDGTPEVPEIACGGFLFKAFPVEA